MYTESINGVLNSHGEGVGVVFIRIRREEVGSVGEEVKGFE